MEFRRRLPGSVLLDVSSRDVFVARHELGAVNIPLDELGTRAIPELRRPAQILLSCSGTPITVCRTAGLRLKALGFNSVTLLLSNLPDH